MKPRVHGKGRGKRMVQILSYVAVFIALLVVVGLLLHPVLHRREMAALRPYGQWVDVDGNRMHVHAVGDGDETIVLLPGFGVPLPSADFGPLLRELSQDYTAVSVEWFGVGFSDSVDTPRTNANYAKELRMALSQAGFAPPYVLMPHSTSGIYAEYYATQYPDEVKAIIMLDSTSSAASLEKDMPRILWLVAKAANRIGVNRINARLIPETKTIANGYFDHEQADYRTFMKNQINDTLIDQGQRMNQSIQEVGAMPFPETVPVLKIAAADTVQTMDKQNKDNGLAYQNQHIERLGSNARLIVMEGNHFLYQTHASEITAETRSFLDTLNTQRN